MTVKNKTVEIVGYAIGGVGVLIFIAAIMFGTRWFSQAVTPVNVIEVEKGIHCAQMITSDGAAIDCWRVK